MARDNSWVVELKDFQVGYAPLAQVDSLTEKGNAGSASAMTNVDILDGLLTQGPGLSALTNATQAGALTERLNYILDVPPSNDLTYAIGATKLYSLSSTALTNDGTFPHTITGATDGESVVSLAGSQYYFYNKSSGADIGKYTSPSTFDDDWGSTVPTGAAALQKALHPVAVKEDIMAFGNGQYLGIYTNDNTTLAPTKLDFGTGHEVADVVFNNNYWYVAVNAGTTGTNRALGQIFLYDGAAVDSVLADETGVGFQKIGFLYVVDGVVYVAYQDLSSTGGFHIGYVNGRKISRLASFSGTLPGFHQKTLYRHNILFASGASLYTCGAVHPEFPVQISQIASGAHATLLAVAAPFGTPMVASTAGSNYNLSKFSGYTTTSHWRSVVVPIASGTMRGYIDEVSVLTRALGADAAATVRIEANQAVDSSGSKVISGTGATRFNFSGFGLGSIEDFRVWVYFTNGDTTNPVEIRSILVKGHYVES